jgi:hypothetical protein
MLEIGRQCVDLWMNNQPTYPSSEQPDPGNHRRDGGGQKGRLYDRFLHVTLPPLRRGVSHLPILLGGCAEEWSMIIEPHGEHSDARISPKIRLRGLRAGSMGASHCGQFGTSGFMFRPKKKIRRLQRTCPSCVPVIPAWRMRAIDAAMPGATLPMPDASQLAVNCVFAGADCGDFDRRKTGAA